MLGHFKIIGTEEGGGGGGGGRRVTPNKFSSEYTYNFK